MTESYSKDHIKFIKSIKRNKAIIMIMQIVVLLAFITTWEVLSVTGVIDDFLFSSPRRIVVTVGTLAKSGELSMHVTTTLYETIIGFITATLIGTLIAVLFWWSDFIKRVFEPYIVVLNSLPKIALGPLIIIWFGAGTGAIIYMTFLVTVIVTVINMYAGFSEVDKDKELLLKSMGARKVQIFTRLVLPSSLPTFVSTLKINVGMSWIGSIMGEYLVSKQGIGYLIVYGGQVFKLDLVMTGTVILCFLAGLMYLLVAILEREITQKHK